MKTPYLLELNLFISLPKHNMLVSLIPDLHATDAHEIHSHLIISSLLYIPTYFAL